MVHYGSTFERGVEMTRTWNLVNFLLLSLSFTYSVATTWDNQTIDHAPIQITLSSNGTHVELVAGGPFFDDPPGPDGPPGEAYWELWNYEGRTQLRS